MKNYIVTLLVIASFAFGQFSPGPLSKYHAELEGTSNCIECHELGKKEISNGCIECHTPLKLQIDKNKGYHIGERSERLQAVPD